MRYASEEVRHAPAPTRRRTRENGGGLREDRAHDGSRGAPVESAIDARIAERRARLAELAGRLAHFREGTTIGTTDRRRLELTPAGTWAAELVLSLPEVDVWYTTARGGHELPRHRHPQTEVIQVLYGALEVEIQVTGEGTPSAKRLQAHETLFLPSLMWHRCWALEDTGLLVAFHPPLFEAPTEPVVVKA